MNDFQKAKKTEQLTWAYRQWMLAAECPSVSEGHRRLCIETAKAIKLELEDGIARCGCHQMPYSSCPSLLKKGTRICL